MHSELVRYVKRSLPILDFMFNTVEAVHATPLAVSPANLLIKKSVHSSPPLPSVSKDKNSKVPSRLRRYDMMLIL